MPRLRIRRRPIIYWSFTGALALVTGLIVSGAVAGARDARSAYGTARVIIVATRDIEAGESIEAADVRAEARPLAVIPDGALDDPPIGQVASAAIMRGEPLVAARLAGAGVSAIAALVPPGDVGIAVPLDAGALAVSVGDVVEVMATFDPDSIEGPPTIVLAPRAVVVDVRDAAATLAMPESDAQRVAFGLATGVVTVVLLGSG
jgi:Flp pilus assembly protein CpaB